MKPLPNFSVDLIQELDELYPPKCIAPRQALEDAHRYAGQRELIDTLKARLEVTLKQNLKRGHQL